MLRHGYAGSPSREPQKYSPLHTINTTAAATAAAAAASAAAQAARAAAATAAAAAVACEKPHEASTASVVDWGILDLKEAAAANAELREELTLLYEGITAPLLADT